MESHTLPKFVENVCHFTSSNKDARKVEVDMPETDVQETGTGAIIANPAPLGLAAFALTTFVLSSANAKLFDGAAIVIGLALFYGGLAQLLAGMWEFKTGNTFGATAFTSYGAFWLAFGATLQWKLIPNHQALGFFLLGWTIFTGILLIASLRTSVALIILFALLLITFMLLTIGEFTGSTAGLLGGYTGLATSVVAWYTAAAGLLTGVKSKIVLPTGPIA